MLHGILPVTYMYHVISGLLNNIPYVEHKPLVWNMYLGVSGWEILNNVMLLLWSSHALIVGPEKVLPSLYQYCMQNHKQKSEYGTRVIVMPALVYQLSLV